MNELLKINANSDRITLSARELHEFLEVTERFQSWFDRMKQYGFAENIDYVGCKVFNALARQELQDYQITVEMGKAIGMLQRSDKGTQIRNYFIELEKQWNSPEQVMARALDIAHKKINNLQIEMLEMKPKADYYDELVDRNALINFTVFAKELNMKRKDLINYLINHGYLYRDSKNKLLPYARKNDGLFEVKECYGANNDWAGPQTLLTTKGRDKFRNLVKVSD